MKEELEKTEKKQAETYPNTNGTVQYLAVSTQSYFGTCPFKEGVGVGGGVAVNECFWFGGGGRRGSAVNACFVSNM